ncbi:MAG: C25 family cysteine peptidase [Cytophagaceae bacterium]
MRKYVEHIVWLGLLFASTIAKAQFGYEWIVPNQQYCKIQVWENGFYKIPLSLIQQSGVDINEQNKIQMWRRGEEYAIQIQNDSIVFYGEKNDGTLDSILYLPGAQAHKYFNLHSDTSVYFITKGSVDGKRYSQQPNISNSTVLGNVNSEVLIVFAEAYNTGPEYSIETLKSDYDVGEGWFSANIWKAVSQPINKTTLININDPIDNGGFATIEAQVVGYNNSSHNVKLLVGDPSSPDFTYVIPTFNYTQIAKGIVNIPTSYLVGKTSISFTIQVYGSGTNGIDAVCASYIKLTYPKQPKLVNSIKNQTFSVQQVGDYRVIFDNTNNKHVFYNCTDDKNLEVLSKNFTVNQTTLNIDSDVQKILVHNGEYLTNYKVKSANLTVKSNTANFIILYGDILGVSSKEYAIYRASSSGGSYDTARYSTSEIMDVFSFGEFTPLGIKRLVDYHLLDSDDKYLLFIGKGVNLGANFWFNGPKYQRLNPEYYLTNSDPNYHFYNMLPTYGFPGSDLMYSVDSEYKFRIPTGRITARTNDQVIAYLNKVKEHEALPKDLIWRKQLLHLSGGKSAPEILLYKSYVDEYKQYAEGDWFGGKVVKTLVKNLQNGAVDDQLKYSISDILNDGVGHMCFFGHSSSQTIDVDIGFVSNPLYGYNNKGKYPFFLINGCSSADIFDYYSFTEDWILTADKGALNILGHSDVGYSFNLYDYSRRFYYERFANKENVVKSIGGVHKDLVDSLLKGVPYDVVRISHGVQMVLSGDPAIVTYPMAKPDYAIYGDESSKTPKSYIKSYSTNIITAKDSFQIAVPVTNYGSTNTKPVEMLIKRYVNNLLVETYFQPVIKVRYVDTFYVRIPASSKNYQGENRFEIHIDALDSLSEYSESNNLAILNYYMPYSSVLCIYPYNYSIVNAQPLTLIAQSSNNLISENRDFYFELDTNKTFSSPALQTGVVNGSTLAKWNVNLLTDLYPSDSIVYFWRVRFKDVSVGQDTIWDNHSFIYMKNSNLGWSQTHIDQFKEDVFSGINYSANWEYISTTVDISIKAVGTPTISDRAQQSELVLNNVPLLTTNIYNNCNGYGGLLLLVLDKNTLKPVTVNPNSYGWRYCGQNYDTRVIGYFPYVTYDQNIETSTRGIEAQSFMDAIIQTKVGDYIVVMNNGNSYTQTWPNSIADPSKVYPPMRDFFRDTLKSADVYNWMNGDPFIMIYQKGAASPIYEGYVSSNGADNTPLQYSTTLVGKTNAGIVTTNTIGPALEWKKLYLEIDSLNEDHNTVRLVRYDLSGKIMDTINVPIQDSLDLSNGYLADGIHGSCKLIFITTDTLDLTPSILKRWQITYNPAPEALLDPSYFAASMYQTQQKIEGDTVYVTYVFENISAVDFLNPIKATFEIKNSSGTSIIDTVLLSPLLSGNKITYTYKRSTKGLVGSNSLIAYFNPRIQPEIIYDNNSIQTFFNVDADKTQPTMDVAFDGIKIFDGDIVSPSPVISISLRDNNRYLLMNDPSSIELFLLYPGQTTPVQITSTHPYVLSWRLENANTNTFVAEIKPTDVLPDGVYTLFVNGQDASGNKITNNRYSIKFNVVNTPSISNFYPYPNPFSTSCRFVFTLTGSKIPDNIKIQIMTVSGKVVREIMKEELGVIRIGNNITDYSWDGTDEFGDKLANGVYLYRVVIKDSALNLEHYNTNGDKAFHKDFGKLYILR